MFQWITIIVAVVAAGALLVGADQVVKYFQSQDVPAENQLNPTPNVDPADGVAGSAPTADRFPGRNSDIVGEPTASPQVIGETSKPTPDPGVNFSAPTSTNDLDLLDSPEDLPTLAPTSDPDESTPEEEGIRALW